MILFIVILFIFSIIIVYLSMRKNYKKNEINIISGIVFDKNSGKEVEGVEVILGKMEIDNKKNSFIPIGNFKVKTLKDGKFSFEVNKKGIYWIMGVKGNKKILKPINLNGNILEIYLKI